MRTLFPSLSALLLTLAAASGCIVHHDHDTDPPPVSDEPGDISFLWSFAGEQRCSRAGVAEVDVQVIDPASGALVYGDTVDCVGGGLTLVEFLPGTYEVWLDGYSASGTHLYTGEATAIVRGGVLNDLGVVELELMNGTGALSLYWTFLYPSDDSAVTDCATAGVDEVVLEVQPLSGGGEGYAQTFACDDEGVLLEGLRQGSYAVTLVAYGRYQNLPMALYEASFEASVEAESTTSLGDVYLVRIYESFADVEVTWEFAGGSCAQLGVDVVEFSLRRLGTGFEDDFFTVECNRSFVLRRTFVPGSYVVEGAAVGFDGAYLGALTLDVAPNTTAPAHVQLVPME